MTPIIIPCPACGRELKIRDRNLLGRKGKCPKCGHAFLMEEPAAVVTLYADCTPIASELVKNTRPVQRASNAKSHSNHRRYETEFPTRF